MAQATNDEVITEALELAGDSSLKSRAIFWLNRWVISESGKAPWPHTFATLGPMPLPAGSVSILLGGPTGAYPSRVHSVRRLYEATANGERGAPIYFQEQEESAPPTSGTSWLGDYGGATRGGSSRSDVRIISAGSGQWYVMFPDRLNHLRRVHVDLKLIPAIQLLSDVSPYPNDETLMQAIYCYALKHQNDERQMAEEQKLQRMVQEDRATYCKLGGNNQHMRLASRTFPGRRR